MPLSLSYSGFGLCDSLRGKHVSVSQPIDDRTRTRRATRLRNVSAPLSHMTRPMGFALTPGYPNASQSPPTCPKRLSNSEAI